MPRLVPAFVLLLALALVPAAPARAMDAQKVFRDSENAVLVIYRVSVMGRVLSLGSGFVVGDGRQAVTNRHVVKESSTVTVKTADGHVYENVPVEGKSSEHDLAVLRLPYKMSNLELAEDMPAVGQEIVAIGSPLGMERTLSTGVVSGLDRQVRENKGLIQITAPVSHGSSGGPVLDASGRVVGVATLGSVKGDIQNMNFAVPAAVVRDFLGFHPVSDRAPTTSPAALDVQKAPDGSITIIQKRKQQ